MNILTGITGIIFLLLMIRGYRRGLLKSLASVISLIASVTLVSVVTPYVSQFLQEQTSVYTWVLEKCQESFSVPVQESNQQSDAEEVEKSDKNISTQMQEKIIEELPVPDMLKHLLANNNTEKTYKELAVNSFRDYVPKFMANLIMNIISFILTWIIVASFIWLAVMTLDVIANLPVIHGINQILGLILGAGQALVIVWIGFLLITVLGSTPVGKQLLEMIEKSPILNQIYDWNILLNVLQMRG